MLGVGPDGHVASLFPGHPALDVDDRVAVGVTDSPKPPPERITLTFAALEPARGGLVRRLRLRQGRGRRPRPRRGPRPRDPRRRRHRSAGDRLVPRLRSRRPPLTIRAFLPAQPCTGSAGNNARLGGSEHARRQGVVAAWARGRGRWCCRCAGPSGWWRWRRAPCPGRRCGRADGRDGRPSGSRLQSGIIAIAAVRSIAYAGRAASGSGGSPEHVEKRPPGLGGPPQLRPVRRQGRCELGLGPGRVHRAQAGEPPRPASRT